MFSLERRIRYKFYVCLLFSYDDARLGIKARQSGSNQKPH